MIPDLSQLSLLTVMSQKFSHIKRMRVKSDMRAIIPVNGGMSVSVTISPSSMVVSQVIWSLCGNIGAVWHGVMPSVDVRVLLGISSACSMSSCFMISSASIAWPGESEPGVAEYKSQELSVHFGCSKNFQSNITLGFTSFCCWWEKVEDWREDGAKQGGAWWAAWLLYRRFYFTIWFHGFTVAGHCVWEKKETTF